MTAQHLTDQIRLAFPATQFCGTINSCGCEECTHIKEELRNKRWDQISASFLDFTCSPMLLTAEAFVAFVPAYLLRALEDLSGHAIVLEFTVYSLCPNDPEGEDPEEPASREDGMSRLVQRARLMSAAQIQAVRSFLAFVQENASDAEWFRPFIKSALEKVWR